MDHSEAPAPGAPNKQGRMRILAVLLVALLALIGVSLHSQIASLFQPRVPPPPCGVSSIQIGDARLPIQNLTPNTNSDLGVPSGKPGVAFWIQGTTGHYVFGLSPTGDNLSLAPQLKNGDPIKIAWGDCSSDDYVVASIGNAVPAAAALMTQSQSGITIFIPPSGGSDGWAIEGQRPEAMVTPVPETPNPNAVSAEVSFLGQSTSADGKTLTLKLSVKNTGTNVIHLSQGDISLGAVAPTSVDPALPMDIQPGATATFSFTFAKPGGNTAVFKLLDFSVDLYF